MSTVLVTAKTTRLGLPSVTAPEKKSNLLEVGRMLMLTMSNTGSQKFEELMFPCSGSYFDKKNPSLNKLDRALCHSGAGVGASGAVFFSCSNFYLL